MSGVKGRSGRRQKSEARRRLDGSQARPNHYRQVTAPAGPPQRPPDLSAVELEQWREHERLLELRGQLTVDAGPWLFVLAVAAANYQRWRVAGAGADLLVDTVDGVKAHPSHVQMRLAGKHYLELLKEGGLTPGSTARVTPASVPEAPDPFEAFQAQRGLRLVPKGSGKGA